MRPLRPAVPAVGRLAVGRVRPVGALLRVGRPTHAETDPIPETLDGLPETDVVGVAIPAPRPLHLTPVEVLLGRGVDGLAPALLGGTGAPRPLP